MKSKTKSYKNYKNSLIPNGEFDPDINQTPSNREDYENQNLTCPQCNSKIVIKIDPFLKTCIYQCENGHTGNKSELPSLHSVEEILPTFNDQIIKKSNESPRKKRPSKTGKNSVRNYQYFCGEHDEKFISYCITCQKDLCMICLGEHENHEIQHYTSIVPKKRYIHSEKVLLSHHKKKIEQFAILANNLIDKMKYDINKIINTIREKLDENYTELHNFDYHRLNYNLIIHINNLKNELNEKIITYIDQENGLSFYKKGILLLGILNINKNDLIVHSEVSETNTKESSNLLYSSSILQNNSSRMNSSEYYSSSLYQSNIGANPDLYKLSTDKQVLNNHYSFQIKGKRSVGPETYFHNRNNLDINYNKKEDFNKSFQNNFMSINEIKKKQTAKANNMKYRSKLLSPNHQQYKSNILKNRDMFLFNNDIINNTQKDSRTRNTTFYKDEYKTVNKRKERDDFYKKSEEKDRLRRSQVKKEEREQYDIVVDDSDNKKYTKKKDDAIYIRLKRDSFTNSDKKETNRFDGSDKKITNTSITNSANSKRIVEDSDRQDDNTNRKQNKNNNNSTFDTFEKAIVNENGNNVNTAKLRKVKQTIKQDELLDSPVQRNNIVKISQAFDNSIPEQNDIKQQYRGSNKIKSLKVKNVIKEETIKDPIKKEAMKKKHPKKRASKNGNIEKGNISKSVTCDDKSDEITNESIIPENEKTIIINESDNNKKVFALCELKSKNILCVGEKRGTISLYDIKTFFLIFSIENKHTKDILCLTELSDGKLLSCGKDGKINIYEFTSFKKTSKKPIDGFILVQTLTEKEGLSGRVFKCIELSNKYLVSGDTKNAIVWKKGLSKENYSFYYSISGVNNNIYSVLELNKESFVIYRSGGVLFFYNSSSFAELGKLSLNLETPLNNKTFRENLCLINKEVFAADGVTCIYLISISSMEIIKEITFDGYENLNAFCSLNDDKGLLAACSKRRSKNKNELRNDLLQYQLNENNNNYELITIIQNETETRKVLSVVYLKKCAIVSGSDDGTVKVWK